MQSLYVGLDVGHVQGPSARLLPGTTLAGAVVGVRGRLAPKTALGAALDYDLSIGAPVYQPRGFSGKGPTVLFQVAASF